MHGDPDRSQNGVEPPPRLEIVPVDDDLEILALWAAALNAQGYEIAVDECERELEQAVAELGFQTLAFKRAAPRRHLL